jgi:hypothetical protein
MLDEVCALCRDLNEERTVRKMDSSERTNYGVKVVWRQDVNLPAIQEEGGDNFCAKKTRICEGRRGNKAVNQKS